MRRSLVFRSFKIALFGLTQSYQEPGYVETQAFQTLQEPEWFLFEKQQYSL